MLFLKIYFLSNNTAREKSTIMVVSISLNVALTNTAKLFVLIHLYAREQNGGSVLINDIIVSSLKKRNLHGCSNSRFQEGLWFWNQGCQTTELVCFILNGFHLSCVVRKYFSCKGMFLNSAFMLKSRDFSCILRLPLCSYKRRA